MPDEIKYTPFGTPIRKEVPVDCSNPMLAQFGLELDKETGTAHVVEKDPLNLDELIQSYKDQCGIEFAELQLKRGLASPEDYAAVPGDYGDISDLPDNINDAYRGHLAAESTGVDLGQFKTVDDIKAYVEAQVKAQLDAAAKTQNPAPEVKENA